MTPDFADIPAPRIETRDAFRVIGFQADVTNGDVSVLPPVWARFNTTDISIPGAVPGGAYGVCFNGDGKGAFSYIAGDQATGDAPDEMNAVDLPAGRYAVFTHDGPLSEFGRTVFTIWNKGLPDSGQTWRPAPDFELYDERFDVETMSGIVEVWIPVE